MPLCNGCFNSYVERRGDLCAWCKAAEEKKEKAEALIKVGRRGFLASFLLAPFAFSFARKADARPLFQVQPAPKTFRIVCVGGGGGGGGSSSFVNIGRSKAEIISYTIGTGGVGGLTND